MQIRWLGRRLRGWRAITRRWSRTRGKRVAGFLTVHLVAILVTDTEQHSVRGRLADVHVERLLTGAVDVLAGVGYPVPTLSRVLPFHENRVRQTSGVARDVDRPDHVVLAAALRGQVPSKNILRAEECYRHENHDQREQWSSPNRSSEVHILSPFPHFSWMVFLPI